MLKISFQKSHFTVYFCLLYLIFVSAFLLWHKSWFSPDYFFVVALIPTLFLRRLKEYLKDWLPFISLFLIYEFLRGFATVWNSSLHIYEMIDIDRFFFGEIPTIRLQQLLYDSALPHWYDRIISLIYMLHFIVPFTMAFFLWIKNRKFFQEFALALIILSFAGFLTFVLFPAMPPWMASERGYLPNLTRIANTQILPFANLLPIPTVYSLFHGNEVAAVPSLHAAYPFLTLLFLVKFFGKRGFLLLPYVLSVWFAVIYLGEHYFIDIVIGVLYAILSFVLVGNFSKISEKVFEFKTNFVLSISTQKT